MQLFLPAKFSKVITNSFVILDTDFLDFLFKNEEVLHQFLKSFTGELLLLDSLTVFEFLRDMYVPEERIKREEFVNLELFVPMTKNQQQLNKLDENALLLSKLYAHKSVRGASFIDLRLAARLLLYARNSYVLITGNKKHFPSCIFETLSILTVFNPEKEKFLNFSVIKLNSNDFQAAFESLDQVMRVQT